MAAVRMADLPTSDTDVLVVGAGPTGLMAGLVLTRRGVPVVVVDQKVGPTRESRALAVQARTMEVHDQLGLADRVLSGAHPALRIQIGKYPPLEGVRIDRLQQSDTLGSRASRSSSRAPTNNSCPAHSRRRAPTCFGGTGWWTWSMTPARPKAGSPRCWTDPPVSSASGRDGASAPTGPARPSVASWIFRLRASPTRPPSGLQTCVACAGCRTNRWPPGSAMPRSASHSLLARPVTPGWWP